MRSRHEQVTPAGAQAERLGREAERLFNEAVRRIGYRDVYILIILPEQYYLFVNQEFG